MGYYVRYSLFSDDLFILSGKRLKFIWNVFLGEWLPESVVNRRSSRLR